VGSGVQTGSTRHRGHLLPYGVCPGWLWRWRISRWNEDWQGNPKYSEKTCPSPTLSTTNPTRPDPGSNPGRRGGKPATNRLSYGVAISTFSNIIYSMYILILSSHVLVHPRNILFASSFQCNIPRTFSRFLVGATIILHLTILVIFGNEYNLWRGTR
jgi:hypothetical protein